MGEEGPPGRDRPLIRESGASNVRSLNRLCHPGSGRRLQITELLRDLEEDMQRAAADPEFEHAALLRDQIMEVKNAASLANIEPK